MNIKIRFSHTVFLGAAMLFAAVPIHAQNLEEGFRRPPQEAQPRTWWHWVSGNVSKEGITQDLEAMKRIGLGEAQIFNVNQGPLGPIKTFSDEWRQLTLHAIREADRLGLQLAIHNCAGWTESGGPWVKPEQSMQFVFTSEALVSGGQTVKVKLPENHPGWRDIAVWAFPTLPGDMASPVDLKPKLSASAGAKDLENAVDGNASTAAVISKGDGPQFFQAEFSEEATFGSLRMMANEVGPQGGEVQVSEDGVAFRTVGRFAQNTFRNFSGSFAPVKARIWRLVFERPKNTARIADITVRELTFGGSRLANMESKAAFESKVESRVPTQWDVPAEMAIDPRAMVNLSDRIALDGTLEWTAPAGNWTIVRFCHASSGRSNGPATNEARGLECDKLSREAVTAHFNNGLMGMVLGDAGPLAGKVLKYVLADSWEAGSLNWTPAMRPEFQKRCGYDPLPWLPALTGRVVGTADQSERFLWDFRRVIADLVAENHYGVLQELAHQHGMQLYAEAPGIGMPTIADELQCKARTDIPMGEFWIGEDRGATDVKETASAAHINGLRWAAAEAFTANAADSAWKNDPFGLKALGDRSFCRGINRIVFHRYAHQPFTDKFPGVTMGPWGLNFERTQTWWEQGRAWMDYLSRCQWLLSQGHFVADVCSFYGEDAPITLSSSLETAKGYDYDACDAETLQKMEVRDGRLVLPGGMSYRVLTLAKTDRMTPKTLAKVRDLVQAGATVLGAPPVQSPSLQNYPQADGEVKKLAEELWGSTENKPVDRQVGKGRVVCGKPLAQLLPQLGVPADFSVAPATANIMAIHRQSEEGEIYFVSNQTYKLAEIECTFRVSGRVPELWHPDSGVIENAPIYRQDNGCTTFPLRLDAAGSVFVVFRKVAETANTITSFQLTDSSARPKRDLQILRAAYAAVDDSAKTFDVTGKIAELAKTGSVELPVSNGAFGKDPAPNLPKQLTVEYTLDGQSRRAVVNENQSLCLGESDRSAVPFELSQPGSGPAVLTRWTGGTYTATFASGKQWQRTLPDVAPKMELSGPWKLSFPPKWGAPGEVTLQNLISWTDHPDEGVQHFSGTASYAKEFQVSAEQLAPNKVLKLNLGEIKNLAEVTVNGKNLGILWKPPFSVNLTGIVKLGRNTLEVKVTNLWPNRLIGDQKLPPEQRFTWTTFDAYKAESSLLPSGLLGPVTIETGETLPVVP